MPIKFRCEHCRQLLGISQTKSGENVDCPTCGRSVQVPTLDGSPTSSAEPKWNASDQSLLQALNSLASLNLDSPEQSSSSQPEDDQESATPAPLVDSQPLELPPLETPVVISESVAPPIVESIPDPQSNDLKDSEATANEEAMSNLAVLSSLTHRGSSTESPTPPASSQSSPLIPTPATPGKKGLTIPVVCLLTLLAFGLGFYAGTLREPKTQASLSGKLVESDAVSPTVENETTAENNKSVAARPAIKGRITYRTPEGNTRPDEGAVVIFLPAYRKSSARLPIVGFRPADSAEDRQIALAGLRALGGDYAKVGEDGNFTSKLSQAGEYHVLVLSRHAKRPADTSVSPIVRSSLGDFFERPQQLLGQLAYEFGTVNYNGEKTEIWDHAFDAT